MISNTLHTMNAKSQKALIKQQEGMMVTAICNGTVIDHIPPRKLFKIAHLLQLEDMEEPITIGNNLDSRYLGKKGIIKISGRMLSDEEASRIALLAPDVHVNIIKDYEVVEKRTLHLPEEIIGFVKCPNAKCITNNEPVCTHFHLIDAEHEVLRCHYCGRKVSEERIELQ